MKKTIIIYYSQTKQSKRIAEILASKLSADLYEIQTIRLYNNDMWIAYEESKQELKEGKLPELKGKLPDIKPYDMVIIGGPVWEYTLSNPILSFMRKMDFSEKTVTSFWTFYDHDEKYNDSMKKEAKGAKVLDGISLPRSITTNTTKLNYALDNWIKRIYK